MSLLDALLLRLGLVRLKAYGLTMGPDGRLITASPDEAASGWTSTDFLPPTAPVDLLQPDRPRLARASVPPPIAPTKLAKMRKSAELPAAVASEPVASEPVASEPSVSPMPAALEPSPAVSAAPSPQPAPATEPTEEEWEWKLAMARAKAEKADDVDRPSRRVASGTADPVGEEPSDEEWEWKLAMARAKSDEELPAPGKLAEGSGPTPLVSQTVATQPITRKHSSAPAPSAKPLPSVRR